jgi:hypothetical protein
LSKSGYLKLSSFSGYALKHITGRTSCFPIPRGARASAVIYGIVETAKANDLIPFEYLTHLFEQLPNLGNRDLDELLL